LGYFYILANVLLDMGMPQSSTSVFPKNEGGMQVLTGLAPSDQTVGILIENPLACKVGQKNDLSKAPITNFYIFANVLLFFDKFT
jgi:hypothetical protein